MEFLVFISYVFFAFLLFLFLNFVVKKFSLTKVEYVLFTNIFLVFLAGFASYFHFTIFCDDIFIIVVFEFLIRMLYTTYLRCNCTKPKKTVGCKKRQAQGRSPVNFVELRTKNRFPTA